jgi:hypothetical protein
MVSVVGAVVGGGGGVGGGVGGGAGGGGGVGGGELVVARVVVWWVEAAVVVRAVEGAATEAEVLVVGGRVGGVECKVVSGGVDLPLD